VGNADLVELSEHSKFYSLVDSMKLLRRVLIDSDSATLYEVILWLVLALAPAVGCLYVQLGSTH
jgi:hypothetical protein